MAWPTALSPPVAPTREPSRLVRPTPTDPKAVAYSPNSVTIFRAMRLYFAKNQMPIEFVLYSTYDGLNEALQKGQVDLAWNSPLGHAKFHQAAGDSQAVTGGLG